MNWKLLSWIPWIAFSVVTVSAGRAHQDKTAPLGLFENHADVGTVLHPGSATYDDASQTFTVSGSGENMWFNNDAFHFAWQRVSGDVALAANIAFVGSGGNEHRKAVLMIRQSLDADSVYADLALHGSGLTSLQYRDERGALTHEIQSNVSGPSRLRMKNGDNTSTCGWPLRAAIFKWRAVRRAFLWMEPFMSASGYVLTTKT